MGAERAVVVEAGDGQHVGNVEFLARSIDTERFNLAIVTIEPRRSGPASHVHDEEDDSFYMLEGELIFTVDDEDVIARPGTFILVPPGVAHSFANHTDEQARFVNVHAPAGFDRRIEG